MDTNSVEYKERRARFLNDQERLHDLVVEQQGGVLAESLSTAVYNLYVKEDLTTEQVAARVDSWAKGLDLVITHKPVCVVTPQERIEEALHRAHRFAGIDGSWHKDYCIDQMVRALTGPDYREWVKEYEDGEDGAKTYTWGIGDA